MRIEYSNIFLLTLSYLLEASTIFQNLLLSVPHSVLRLHRRDGRYRRLWNRPPNDRGREAQTPHKHRPVLRRTTAA